MITEEAIVQGSTQRLMSIEECRPELQELHAVWQSLRHGRTMPARRDFDPTAVPKLLPDIFLVDVLPDRPPEGRYRVRVQGTAQVAYHGTDWTGSYLHELVDAATAARFIALGDYIVESREPWMSTGNLYWLPRKPFYRFETVMLPLSDDNRTVNMILGLTRLF
jgi:hypothetical protein